LKKNQVYIVSLIVLAVIVAWGLFGPSSFEAAANGAYAFLSGNFGWLYLLAMSSFVAFSVWIAFSKYGKIKLGKDDSVPDYSLTSWFAMLFSAGMGIGLVFWGAAEPLSHFANPMYVEAGSREAAEFAIRKSFFHWGLHPWAGYSVLALALAYMQFRKDKPGLISSIFIPLLGEERIAGPIGKTVDILAVFATVAGMATSLGLGAYQINSGLNMLYGLPENNTVILAIVGIITVIYILTAVMGIDKGIKTMSDLNVVIAAVLLLATLIIGPTLLILNTFTNGLGDYLQTLVGDSFFVDPFGDSNWTSGWTVFYWAWWIAWAPFVGTFIARISRGRTIKEFVFGVLLAPTLASFVWFSVFGATGINLGVEIAAEASKNPSTALFVVLSHYPMGTLLSTVAVVLLCTFFITSANSATYVLGMMTSNGSLNPSNLNKTIWGLIQSGLALVLMLSSANGLKMLQTASIAAGFPFAIVMVFGMFSLFKAIRKDPAVQEEDVIKITNRKVS